MLCLPHFASLARLPAAPAAVHPGHAGTPRRTLTSWLLGNSLGLVALAACASPPAPAGAPPIDAVAGETQGGDSGNLRLGDATGGDGARSTEVAAPDTSSDSPVDTPPSAQDSAPDSAPDSASDSAAPPDTTADAPSADMGEDAPVTETGGESDAANPEDAPTPDTPPAPKPDNAEIGPAVPAQVQLLWPSAVGFAAAAEGASVLAEAGTLTLVASDAELPPVILQGNPGKLAGVAVVGPGQLLVAGSLGLFGAVNNKLLLSPLQKPLAALTKTLLTQAVAAKTWLWLITTEGVWRHDGTLLQPLQLTNADVAAVAQGIWSLGPAVAIDSQTGMPSASGTPTPALWLYWNGAVHALTVQGNLAKLWFDEAISEGLQLDADGEGNLWLLCSDGTLHRRDAGGAWQWLALPEAVTAIAARPDLPFATFAGKSGAWLHQKGVFYPLLNSQGWALRDLTATGALVVSGPLGLARLVPGEVKPPPPLSWAVVIEPIHKARCASCHGPTAVTVKLPTAAAWKQWFAKINMQLDVDDMPLVGQKLSPQQKAQVKLWGKGGFAP